MKIYSLISTVGAALLLQACALGALSESEIQLQPVLKPADHQARVIDDSVNSRSTQATSYSEQGTSATQNTSSSVKVHAVNDDDIYIESNSDADLSIEPTFDSNSESNAEEDIFSADDEQSFNDRAPTNYKASEGIEYRGNDILSAPIQLAESSISNADLATSGVTFLQIGMFRSEAGAMQVQANAQAATDADVHINNESEGEYRVLVGPLTPDQVERVKTQLANAGLSYFRHLR